MGPLAALVRKEFIQFFRRKPLIVLVIWTIQLLSLLSPLRYYMEIGLGIFMKGVGMDVLWPQALAMGGLGLAILGLGLWRFGRHLG